MSLHALLLIFVAAAAHASWNLLAKRKAGCKNLIWFSSIGESVLFFPIVVSQTNFLFHDPTVATACLLATGVFHLLYTECLLRGYRSGDLSIVYPLARGTGPLLAFIGAVICLGERPSPASVLGALAIAAGLLVVCGGMKTLRQKGARTGIIWGAATGVVIAGYTVVDGYAVKALFLSPFLVEYAGNFFRTIVLSGGVDYKNGLVRTEWKQCWKEALGISVLTPVGYVLVLFAMRIAPVSHVAPAREISMMLGAWMGAKFLNEGNAARRVVGSCLIAAGVAALTIG